MTVETAAQLPVDDVPAALAGDRDAFSRLVRLHQRSVFGLALRLHRGDEQAARDTTQKAFLQAWAKREGFRAEASFKTWLLRITANLASNERRRAWRRREVVPVADDGPVELGSVPPMAFDALDGKRARARLRIAVDALPTRQRDVAILRLYADLSFAQIADALGITANNAKVCFHHACRKVREHLGDAGVAS